MCIKLYTQWHSLLGFQQQKLGNNLNKQQLEGSVETWWFLLSSFVFLHFSKFLQNASVAYMIRGKKSIMFLRQSRDTGHVIPAGREATLWRAFWQHMSQSSNSPSRNALDVDPHTNAPRSTGEDVQWCTTCNGKRLKPTWKFTQRDWLNKLWYIHTKECCVIKKKEMEYNVKNGPWYIVEWKKQATDLCA